MESVCGAELLNIKYGEKCGAGGLVCKTVPVGATWNAITMTKIINTAALVSMLAARNTIVGSTDIASLSSKTTIVSKLPFDLTCSPKTGITTPLEDGKQIATPACKPEAFTPTGADPSFAFSKDKMFGFLPEYVQLTNEQAFVRKEGSEKFNNGKDTTFDVCTSMEDIYTADGQNATIADGSASSTGSARILSPLEKACMKDPAATVLNERCTYVVSQCLKFQTHFALFLVNAIEQYKEKLQRAMLTGILPIAAATPEK